MRGRVRLSNDYSEIKIRLKFGANAAASNFAPSWNIPPTGPMIWAGFSNPDNMLVPGLKVRGYLAHCRVELPVLYDRFWPFATVRGMQQSVWKLTIRRGPPALHPTPLFDFEPLKNRSQFHGKKSQNRSHQ
jgi:hypothetical protein